MFRVSVFNDLIYIMFRASVFKDFIYIMFRVSVFKDLIYIMFRVSVFKELICIMFRASVFKDLMPLSLVRADYVPEPVPCKVMGSPIKYKQSNKASIQDIQYVIQL